MTKRVIKSQ